MFFKLPFTSKKRFRPIVPLKNFFSPDNLRALKVIQDFWKILYP